MQGAPKSQRPSRYQLPTNSTPIFPTLPLLYAVNKVL